MEVAEDHSVISGFCHVWCTGQFSLNLKEELGLSVRGLVEKALCYWVDFLLSLSSHCITCNTTGKWKNCLK